MLELRQVLIALAVSPSTLLGCSLHAEQFIASAVDASGKRHLGSREFPGLDEPWIRDRLKFVPPDYSYADRAQHHQGDGLFRISLDVKTGLVTQVAIVKTTGFPSLDASAIAAIHKWRWKPGRWKEVDIPMRVVMRRS